MSSNRRNLIILFTTMVVMMIGFGLVIPILPFYIEWLGASGRDLGLLMGAYALMQLICAPFWGGLSDRIGRKPVLLFGVLGNALSMLFMGLSTTLWMLFTARILAGILSSATFPTAMAYISDSTSEENRGGGMGGIAAAMGVGMVLGPGLGGWLGGMNLSVPFFVAAGLSILVLMLIFLILPESLPPERRSQATGKMRGPDFRPMWQSLFGSLGYLMVLSFLLSFGLTNFEAIFGLYALERFGYGPEQVGTVFAVIGITSVLVQGLLTGPLTRRWGEGRVIQGALLMSAIGFLVLLTAFNFATVLLTICFFMVGNTLLRPTTAALISKRSNQQEQGAFLGLHNSFMSLGRIAGPTWAGFVFDFNMSLPYISGAVIMALSLLTSFVWLTQKQSQTVPYDVELPLT
jgi:DHA1 family multidrug resistance protein-like MFS transporter